MGILGWWKSRGAGRDRKSLSLAEARLKRGEVVLGDLHELATSIAEARFENDFNNAKAAFLKQEFEVSAALLNEIRNAYAESNHRTLRESTGERNLPKREARILEGRRASVQKILDDFDRVIEALRQTADRDAQRRTPASQSSAAPPSVGLSPEFLERYAAASDATAQGKLVNERYRAITVNTKEDVKSGALYALRQTGKFTLLLTADRFPSPAFVPISDALSGQELRPLPVAEFLALGKKRELIQLQPRQRHDVSDKEGNTGEGNGAAPKLPSLDISDFNQLVLAADQSGLLSSVAISNARDQYYRREKYQNAFGAIERVYQEFVSKATQRMATLKREEEAFKRGRLKMSPREWQQKQARDIAQTQRVERTRRHFKLVLDGLRLLHLRQQQMQEEEAD